MELRHIRYFLAVAEELSFTRAAEKLMIAQPPLSRQIRDLEEELGAPLFIRQTHALRLSEEGQLFRQYALQVMTLVDQSVSGVREMHQGLHGTLYLATVEGNAPHLISEWIAGFHALHPHVQYDLWNGNSDDVTTRVMRGLSELALIVAPFNTEGLDGLPVYREPWVAMMSSDHPLAAYPGDALPLAMLRDEQLIIPSRQSRQLEIGEWFTRIGIVPHILCRMSNTINAIELAMHGVGVAIYPASNGNMPHARAGQANPICVKRLTEPSVTAQYVLVRAKNRPLSRVAGEFLRYIKGRVQEEM
ncbi:MAG: LysR family transcriptional regulator [bacterium]|nr:LysR family transcriptional regulator [bacterium]